MRGWPRIVKVGYKKKRTKRGLHPSGRREVLVKRVEDLDKIDSKTQIVKIGHSVGERKRVAILEKAQTLELTIANPGPKKREAAPPEEQELVVKEAEAGKTEQEETEEETGGKTE
jgi:large subunit ribosomal protein L32e